MTQDYKTGDRVSTTSSGYLLKGTTIRYGYVVGFCKQRDSVRVRWDGWERKSSQAIALEHLQPVTVASEKLRVASVKVAGGMLTIRYADGMTASVEISEDVAHALYESLDEIFGQ